MGASVPLDDLPTSSVPADDLPQGATNGTLQRLQAAGLPYPGQPIGRGGRVIQNAITEAAAGMVDMFLNAPSNVWNLSKAAAGSLATAAGYPEYADSVSPAPNYARRALQAIGAINTENEPKTQGEQYASALAQGATAGAAGGIPGMIAGAGTNLVGQAVGDLTGNQNVALAAALGAQPLIGAAKNLGDKRIALAESLKSEKSPLKDTLERGRESGYVAPPATTNPTLWNKILEGIGGKAATQQDSAVANQSAVNSAIRKELGNTFPEGITDEALDVLSKQAAQPYAEVAALPAVPRKKVGTVFIGETPTPMMGKANISPADALKELNQARIDMKDHWREYQRQGSVSARDAYKAAEARALQMESELERAVLNADRPDLVDAMRDARQRIAKIHDVQRALNADRGEISALDLAKAKERGVPLTGELLTAAKFGNAFPKSVQRPEQIGSPTVNNLNSILGSGIGASLGAVLGGGAPGASVGAMAGAVATPTVQALVRKLLLSKPYQGSFGTPNYMQPDYFASSLSQIAGGMPNAAEDALLRAYIFAQQRQGQ